MDYIASNKAAWEEAFAHKYDGWGEDNHIQLQCEHLPFFYPDVVTELQAMDWTGKRVAQFCCNNGRELLSLMQLGAAQGVGFDIAENIIAQAADTAQKADIHNCQFISCNILDIDAQYHHSFDFILFTVGSITWFKDLDALFQTVSDCLKPGGTLLIHDFHPVTDMLPMPGDPEFDGEHLDRIAYSYFRKQPWIENEGMSYMTQTYESKVFTSFSHTLSSIINAISGSHMRILKLEEFDYDVGLADVYDGKGLPLSYLLTAEKM